MKHPLHRHLNQLANDRWARQGIRTLLRATIIAASIWCIGMGGSLLWSWPLRPSVLGAMALAAIGVGVGLLLRPRLSPRETARRLDRRFHLDEQLATAVEIAETKSAPDGIAARLVAQSSNTAHLLRRRIAQRQRPPWNDLVTLLALLPVAIGLFILSGISDLNLQAGALPLPPLAAPLDPAQQFADQPQPPPPDQPAVLTPGAGAPAPGVAQQPGQGQQPGAVGDPRTLEALADALRDQSATRPAAEALDRGDLGGAAQQLRELADQASQLSQEARESLADALRNAAEQIEPQDPALADRLRQSAEGLERGGQQASQALDDLARTLDDLQNGQSPSQADGQDQANQGQQNGPGEAGGQGQQGDAGQGGGPGGVGNGAPSEERTTGAPNRLGVPGQPVPLEANGPGAVPAEPSDRQPTTSEIVPGTTSGNSSSSERVQIGADPLRVPLDERDVVQEYFQPQN
jgi:hypothetical protein